MCEGEGMRLRAKVCGRLGVIRGEVMRVRAIRGEVMRVRVRSCVRCLWMGMCLDIGVGVQRGGKWMLE